MRTYTLTWKRISTGDTGSQQVSEPDNLDDDQDSAVDDAIEPLIRDRDIAWAALTEIGAEQPIWSYQRV